MNQTVPPTEDQEPGDPEWLRQMHGWEDTPDWLRKLIRSDEQAPGPTPASGLAGVDAEEDAEVPGVGAPDLADVSDLVDAIASADAQEAAELELEQATDASPSQKAPMDTGAPADAGAPVDTGALDELVWPPVQEDESDGILSPELEGDDIPDWLLRMSPAAAAAAATEAAAEPKAEPEATAKPEAEAAESVSLSVAEDQDIPDWLRDLSPPSQVGAEDDRDAPEWLAELDQAGGTELEGDLAAAIGAPPFPEEPPEAADEAEVPDWLLDLAEEPESDQEGEIAPVLPQEQGLPERLSLVEEEGPALAAGAEPTAKETRPLAADLEAPPPSEDGEFPAWLVDMAEQAPPEGEAESEATDDLEAALALPTVEDIVGDAQEAPVGEDQAEDELKVAEWLYTVEEEPPPHEPILAFGEGELLQEEMPEWVDELRIQEPERAAPESVVETSGPLAGLSGLINPDPLFGMTYKADYAALPPASDAQQEQARLLRTFLAAPSKRPEIAPVPPGRAAMARLGRWVIYAALLAAICAAIFAPALQELIQPPQTVEAEAFYNAVSGLPQGSEVLLVVDYDASHDGELTPQARAVLWHLMNSNLGVVMVSHTPQGAAIVEDLVRDNSSSALVQEYVAGEHYLNLGYLPPHAALLQAFMANPLGGATLWGAAQAEVAQTPLGQRVARFDDLDLILVVSSNQEHVRWWVEQTTIGGNRAGIVAGVSASAASYLLPYFVAAEGGQIEGMLIGLAGAAEYEQLAGAQFWPNARENVILMGCAQLLLAAIVLASGIRSVFGRSKGA